jgi:hypothetical protein
LSVRNVNLEQCLVPLFQGPVTLLVSDIALGSHRFLGGACSVALGERPIVFSFSLLSRTPGLADDRDALELPSYKIPHERPSV